MSVVIPSSYDSPVESTSFYIMDQFNINNLNKMCDSLHSIQSNEFLCYLLYSTQDVFIQISISFF